MVLLPYNYLVDPILRRSVEVELRGSIVVVDEGHNIHNAAEEAMSFEISITDFFKALNSVKDLGELLKKEERKKKEWEEAKQSQSGVRQREVKASLGEANWVKNTLRSLVIFIKELNLDENK